MIKGDINFLRIKTIKDTINLNAEKKLIKKLIIELKLN